MINFKVNVDHLRSAGEIKRVIESYQCEALADSVKHQQFSLSYSATLLGNEVLVRGEVQGTVTLECCRCLESYTYPIRFTFSQAYPDTDTEIDVESEVRQLLILELPDKPLCKEACKGICPDCGKNRNKVPCHCHKNRQGDPRWDKLKDILK